MSNRKAAHGARQTGGFASATGSGLGPERSDDTTLRGAPVTTRVRHALELHPQPNELGDRFIDGDQICA